MPRPITSNASKSKPVRTRVTVREREREQGEDPGQKGHKESFTYRSPREVRQLSKMHVAEPEISKNTAPEGVSRWVPSMKSAASIMGLDVAALKEAKDAGCRAFDASGRVHTGRLAEWLAEHPDVLERAGGAASYKVEVALKTRADRKLREHRLAVLRGEYVAAADVQRWTAAIAHGVRTIVDRLHQCAAGIVGLPVPDAEARLIEAEDEIISQLHRFADLPVGDVLCPHCAKSVFAPSRTKSRPAPSIVDDPTQSDESVTDPV